jgi:phosphocarrier protein
MKEISYTIKDPLGIHARPAGLLIKKLEEFSSEVTITRGSDSCGKKLLALMKMRVKPGDTLALRFEGADEAAAAGATLAYLSEIL